MASHDKQGRPYLKFNNAVVDQTVWLDGDFTCRNPGPVKLENLGRSIGFRCDAGFHALEGQDDGDGFCVGVYGSDPNI